MEPPVPPSQTGPQVIPRPDHHRPGGPAPWAHLPSRRRRPLPLDRVLDAVTGRDTAADRATTDRELAEFARFHSAVDVATRPSAVLVPLFEEDGETRVLLTVRSGRLRSHRGEVAFPGGRLDPGETVAEGALREAAEEVGLSPVGVELVGTLTPMPTVASNTVMTPLVARLPGRPATRPAPDEVARIFDVALADLASDGVFAEEYWAVPGRQGADGRPGGEFPVFFFGAAGETIWGATARVLTELLCLVLGVEGPAARVGRTPAP